jgi:toxin ParE1/3/4
MMPFRVSLKAEHDLQDIGDYIALDNPPRAFSFVTEIEKRFGEIARQPKLFRLRDEICPGIRTALHGNYMIFFTIANDGVVDFVRVLHGARNFSALAREGGFQ